jgi:hypothetical protein
MKQMLIVVLTMCTLGGCVAQPFATMDDPRPDGRLSMRERSLCESPEASAARANWCDYPHEVRVFLDQRDSCDHFRGEPWPEGNDLQAVARRKALRDAMATSCKGTDARLIELRAIYRNDADILGALAELENDIEP